MKDYVAIHPWQIIEKGFHPEYSKVSESIFSIGNGRMGQRANFEETYSGKSLQGSYLAGVYYPDKTRVGWWKNGYPEYFAKVLNSVSWNQIAISVDGELIDLNIQTPALFERVLDMKKGTLTRSYTLTTTKGITLDFRWSRFVSMKRKDIGAIKLQITASAPCNIQIKSVLSGDVYNQDSNYDEFFWEDTQTGQIDNAVYVTQKTKKTNFLVKAISFNDIQLNNNNYTKNVSIYEKVAVEEFNCNLSTEETLTFYKYVAVCNSMYYDESELFDIARKELGMATAVGWTTLLEEHEKEWATIWSNCDVEIEGDDEAQQAIRFNIFQLFQTYTGDDSRLNIGPKGFTGEKYGGSTYWDTEAYCLPFYLATAPESVAKNLLLYRYNQLGKAIENAEKLGFSKGAALYPMVTMNGEECHNEWEITFEEIHRNGAIAYAIYDYVNYTGDTSYLWEYGVEVLTGISRFWSQRVHFSQDKKAYVMLGVTGPNEFENNVNNNWYTNKFAVWCLRYTLEQWEELYQQDPIRYQELLQKLALDIQEFDRWKDIISNMYFPFDNQRNIYLQQDGFLDKELIPVSQLPESQRPIVEHWSWDRILRSCYIKQADVLQGFYFFEDEFDHDMHKRHFDFYEPLTVHESSLSPCIHSILANKIGNYDKAYEFYLRTSRLDLNDINNDTCDGCHITSMAGTWMTISKGFAGMRVKNATLHLAPHLPEHWSTIRFNIRFRNNYLRIALGKNSAHIENLEGPELTVVCFDKEIRVASSQKQIVTYE
jgi:maltose phosphorylase